LIFGERKKDNEENWLTTDNQVREQVITSRSFFALFITVIIMVAVGFCLSRIPNKLDLDFINKHYKASIENFYPEKSELMQYVVLTVMFPIMFCLMYLWIARSKIKFFSKTSNFVHIYGAFLAVGLSGIVIYVSSNTILVKDYAYYNLKLCIITGLCLLVTAYGYERLYKKWYKTVAMVLLIVVVLFVSWLYINTNYFMNLYTVLHFDAYFYPVSEVYNGKTLIVDFSSLYGFYPYVISLILWAMGGISIFKFSLIMAVLILIINSSVLVVMWQNVKNKIIVIISFMAFLYYSNAFYPNLNGYYLQYNPQRMLCPALILLICSLFANSKSNVARLKYTILGYVICTFSLFWNIDTGAIVILAWCVFLIYNELLVHNFKELRLYIKTLKILLFTAISSASAYILIVIITLARTGKFINVMDMVSGQTLFLGSGFFMLPMDLIHPWVLLVSVYAISLVKALRNLSFMRRGKATYSKRFSLLYFILSILGLGLFSYYQGRSHDQVFMLVIWPAFIILGLLIQEYFDIALDYLRSKNKSIRVKSLVSVVKVTLLFLLISSFAVSFVMRSFDGTIVKNYVVKSNSELPDWNKGILNFIKENTPEGEDPYIMTRYFEVYYSILGAKNNMGIRSSIDWFTIEDYNIVMHFLKTTDHDIFMDRDTYDLLKLFVGSSFTKVLAVRFDLVERYNDVSFYEITR